MASDSEQLRLSRETAKAFEETLRLTREQFRVGVGSELEVRQAETSYQGAVNDIAALETSVDRKSAVYGKRVSVRVDLGGRRIVKKKTTSSVYQVTETKDNTTIENIKKRHK